ncbi:MAG: hypothetical protein ACHQVS_01150 [Candidatus Babeliales bacterium]
MNKISLVMLSALVMSSSVFAASNNRQSKQAKSYAQQKGVINGEISRAELMLQEKNFKVNDIKRMLEMAKQDVRDAIQNVTRSKEENHQLDTWFTSLPARSGEKNQITEAHSYAIKKEAIDNKIIGVERILQEKDFRVQDITRMLEMAQQEQHDATRELEVANKKLAELDQWFRSLPR